MSIFLKNIKELSLKDIQKKISNTIFLNPIWCSTSFLLNKSPSFTYTPKPIIIIFDVSKIPEKDKKKFFYIDQETKENNEQEILIRPVLNEKL